MLIHKLFCQFACIAWSLGGTNLFLPDWGIGPLPQPKHVEVKIIRESLRPRKQFRVDISRENLLQLFLASIRLVARSLINKGYYSYMSKPPH
ncbi:hypothetical protein DFAR_1310005 [Desulfarculales bacterium]